MVGSLVVTEKSPLVKLRAIAHKVKFYPLDDFVHLCYLQDNKCPPLWGRTLIRMLITGWQNEMINWKKVF